jgi:uncharacterized protein YndB with AHSA1/START domain
MPAIHLTTTINAPIGRVWRALCDPPEVVQWDATVVEALDAPPDYPQPGQHVLWRIAGSEALLHDRPQDVEAPSRLHSLLAFGRDEMDETYALTAIDNGTTRLDCTVEVSNSTPVVGWLIARVRSLPEARKAFAASLANLKRHCESMA